MKYSDQNKAGTEGAGAVSCRGGGEQDFLEFRRKVQASELLSAATVRLLEELHFTGKVSVVVHDGRILKSGYEEGYFRRR